MPVTPDAEPTPVNEEPRMEAEANRAEKSSSAAAETAPAGAAASPSLTPTHASAAGPTGTITFQSLIPPGSSASGAPTGTAAFPSFAPPAAAPAPGRREPDPNSVVAAQAAASDRPRRAPAKTILGLSPEAAMTLAKATEQAAPMHAPEAQPPATTPHVPGLVPKPGEIPASKGNPLAKTMMGMAVPASLAAAAPSPPQKKTLFGAGAPPSTPPGADAAAGGSPSDRGPMARTMLGMAPFGSSPPTTGPGAASPVPPGFGGRTMLGVPQGHGTSDAATANVPTFSSPPRTSVPAREASRETERSAPPQRREIRALWPLVAATLVVVVATLVLLLRPSQGPQVEVSAKIVSSETGEALLFEVPSAPDGSKIRFGGQEKPLAAGRASFALAADSLRVGDNLVLADVLRPGSEPAPVRITLAVYYRIWVDTAALRGDRSALDVVVTALPGTSVTLDGEALKLDAAGRGVRNYPIDVVSEAKSGVIEHVVRYRVQPPSGETVVDELRTRIPVAMMQVDRPGREVLTDRESIEIAGAVGKDTQVHLDKTALPVKDGRFLYRLMLPEPGNYAPRLVASAPGKAPLGVTLSIQRVKDLGQAAAQFTPVPDLSYAKLVPNPAIYRGQKIALEGRVYAVDPRGAESVIQMFVRPCPSSRRCPLWVSDPHATETAVDAWVRVLGTVQGEQQFRSEKNEIVTVPKVEAQFVLPAKP